MPARNTASGGNDHRGRNDSGSSYRLFIAIDIPDDAVTSLVAWQQQYLAGERVLRLTPPGQLHVTLVFLGHMREEELSQASAQLEQLQNRDPFPLVARRLVGLPRGRSPRVVAAVFDDAVDRPRQLHDELADGLAAKHLYKKEKRLYFPHVTIARARGRTRLDLLAIEPEPVQFTAVRVTLYNSILKQSGAVHQPLKSVQLN